MTPTNELVGRRVRVLAWYDHAPLVTAYRESGRPEGTITHVNGLAGEPAVSVQIDGLVGTYTFKLGDVEVLPWQAKLKEQKRPVVLLVDDHSATRSLLRRTLALCGWDVLEAATAAEGLARLDPPPDCIVLDLELPDAAGETILRKVRMERLPVRVVVHTGMLDLARLSEVRDLRPDAVLQKPLDSAGLRTICEMMPAD